MNPNASLKSVGKADTTPNSPQHGSRDDLKGKPHSRGSKSRDSSRTRKNPERYVLTMYGNC